MLIQFLLLPLLQGAATPAAKANLYKILPGEEVEKEVRDNTWLYQGLIDDFNKNIRDPIEKLTLLLEHKLNATEEEFAFTCRSLFRPIDVIQAMNRTVVECGEPTIDWELFASLSEFVDKKSSERDEDEHFHNKLSVIYYQLLSNGPDFTKSFFEWFTSAYGTKNILLNSMFHRLNEGGWTSGRTLKTSCLFKAAFVASGFQSEVITQLRNKLAHYLDELLFISDACLILNNNGDMDVVDQLTEERDNDIALVKDFLDSWTYRLMENTFPKLQENLARNYIHNNLDQVPFSNESYTKLAHSLKNVIRHTGSPDYRTEFVVTYDYSNSPSKVSFFCAPGSCFNISMNSVTVYGIRINIMEPMYLSKFSEFSRAATSQFERAMQYEYGTEESPEEVLSKFNSSHGVDLTVFTKHHAVILLHESNRFVNDPENTFGMSFGDGNPNVHVSPYYHKPRIAIAETQHAWSLILVA